MASGEHAGLSPLELTADDLDSLRVAVELTELGSRRKVLDYDKIIDVVAGEKVRHQRGELPQNAADVLLAEVPRLLAVVDEAVSSPKEDSLRRQSLKRASKVAARLAGQLDALMRVDHVCTKSFLYAREFFDLWRREIAASLAARVPNPRGGRQKDLWRRTLLQQLALFWYSRGWKPTTTTNGPYVRVAARLMEIRARQRGDGIKDVELRNDELKDAINTTRTHYREAMLGLLQGGGRKKGRLQNLPH